MTHPSRTYVSRRTFLELKRQAKAVSGRPRYAVLDSFAVDRGYADWHELKRVNEPFWEPRPKGFFAVIDQFLAVKRDHHAGTQDRLATMKEAVLSLLAHTQDDERLLAFLEGLPYASLQALGALIYAGSLQDEEPFEYWRFGMADSLMSREEFAYHLFEKSHPDEWLRRALERPMLLPRSLQQLPTDIQGAIREDRPALAASETEPPSYAGLPDMPVEQRCWYYVSDETLEVLRAVVASVPIADLPGMDAAAIQRLFAERVPDDFPLARIPAPMFGLRVLERHHDRLELPGNRTWR